MQERRAGRAALFSPLATAFPRALRPAPARHSHPIPSDCIYYIDINVS